LVRFLLTIADPASDTSEDSSLIQGAIPDQSIRSATVANLAFAVVALLTNIGLYFCLRVRKQQEISIDTPRGDQKAVPRSILRIVHAWRYAHIFFVVSMLATFLTKSWISRAILVASVGISWSLTLWGPFAIIGYEVAASDSELPTGQKLQAGMIMSLNNIAISAPQLVAAIICSGIFRFAQWMGSADGMGWALRGGSYAAMVAAYYAGRFEKR
jgi:solute carrier family 45 protein 1/2/4